MKTDPDAPHATNAEWPADFRAAEDHALDASLAATPSQRLAWLEEALAFALRVGALPRRDETKERNGIPLMPQRPNGSERPTTDDVNRLRDES
ncbi:MAG: hypothetical protein M3P06_20280 [Acidobacteriota bacterium]|nr:hypothetical protein [Acidobacteriota bacterium]